MGKSKTEILGLPAPESLAEEIFTQAIHLTETLPNLLKDQKDLPSSSLQDALISFSQILLLGFSASFSKLYPEHDLSQYENEVFLRLAHLTLHEFLQREARAAEKEYFLTFYRSHFELLRQELARTGDQILEEGPALEHELKRRLEELIRRFVTQEGEVCYGKKKLGNALEKG